MSAWQRLVSDRSHWHTQTFGEQSEHAGPAAATALLPFEAASTAYHRPSTAPVSGRATYAPRHSTTGKLFDAPPPSAVAAAASPRPPVHASPSPSARTPLSARATPPGAAAPRPTTPASAAERRKQQGVLLVDVPTRLSPAGALGGVGKARGGKSAHHADEEVGEEEIAVLTSAWQAAHALEQEARYLSSNDVSHEETVS